MASKFTTPVDAETVYNYLIENDKPWKSEGFICEDGGELCFNSVYCDSCFFVGRNDDPAEAEYYSVTVNGWEIVLCEYCWQDRDEDGFVDALKEKIGDGTSE